MDTILLIVTGLSLAMAGALAVLLVRMLREERRRSDARVALLQQLAAEPAAAAALPRGARPLAPQARYVEGDPARRSVAPIAVEPGRGAAQRTPPPRVSPPADWSRPSFDDFDLRPAVAPAATSPQEIFQPHDEPSAWPRRIAVAAGMAALIATVGFGWSLTGSTPAALQVSGSAPGAVEQPLELLSLQHTQRNGTLIITGLVQNPRSGPSLSRVQATVLVFGRDGALLTSGRAPLDYTTLAPGDESPFVVRVAAAGNVSRYRVGFRGQDDRVLGHVDRRDPDALARKETP